MTTVVLNTATRKVEVFSSARDVQARAEIADHKAAADPHPQYLADADLADVALSGDAGDLTAGTVPDARMPNWTGYNVASRTALEATNVPAVIAALRLLGYTSIGDGGGALYKRVASEPSHQGKIQSADGAWWEIAETPINVLQFGAKASGLNADASTNTTAFANGIAYLNGIGGGTLLIPAGVYYLGYTAIMNVSNVHIRGAGRVATKVVLRDNPLVRNGPLFHFGDGTDTTWDCSISAMELDGNLANQTQSTTPGESNPALTVQQVDGFNAFDLYIHDCDGYGIGMSGTGHTPRQDVNVYNVEVERTNQDAIDIKGGAQRFFLDNIRVHDTLASPRGTDTVGIDLRGQRVNLSNFWVRNVSNFKSQPGVRVRAEGGGPAQDEINLSNGFVSDCPRGFNMSGGDNTRANMTNCWAKDCADFGMVHSQGNFVLNGCHVDACGGDGVRLESSAKSLTWLGGSIKNSGQDGLYRVANTLLELHGVNVSGNTRHGVRVVGAGLFKMFGGRVIDNGAAAGFGLVLDAVTDEWLLAGAKITGNFSADIQYTGAVVAGQILSTEYDTVSGSAPDGTFNTKNIASSVGTLTPTITCVTPGDLSVVYGTLRRGNWTRNGDRVDFEYIVSFTPTYTSASGTLVLQGLPFPAGGGSNDRYALMIGSIDNANVFGTFDHVAGRIAGGNNYFFIRRSRHGGTSTHANITDFPSGVTCVLEISGTYRV